mmetsp:Transcript_8190/g.20084  ORF Transcript_8190/g.20084 Transcript_8190/m.20084 type:complete len:207 (-) Transcript_8190:3867-4487(-)
MPITMHRFIPSRLIHRVPRADVMVIPRGYAAKISPEKVPLMPMSSAYVGKKAERNVAIAYLENRTAYVIASTRKSSAFFSSAAVRRFMSGTNRPRHLHPSRFRHFRTAIGSESPSIPVKVTIFTTVSNTSSAPSGFASSHLMHCGRLAWNKEKISVSGIRRLLYWPPTSASPLASSTGSPLDSLSSFFSHSASGTRFATSPFLAAS